MPITRYKKIAILAVYVCCYTLFVGRSHFVAFCQKSDVPLTTGTSFGRLQAQKAAHKRLTLWCLQNLSGKKLIRFSSLFTGVAHFNRNTLNRRATPYAKHFLDLFRPGLLLEHHPHRWTYKESSRPSHLLHAVQTQDTLLFYLRQVSLSIQGSHAPLACSCNRLPVHLVTYITRCENALNFCQHTWLLPHNVTLAI